MKLKNKITGKWTTKKTMVLLALILVIPLAVYGINTGVRMYRLYQTVHEPLDEEEETIGKEDPEDESRDTGGEVPVDEDFPEASEEDAGEDEDPDESDDEEGSDMADGDTDHDGDKDEAPEEEAGDDLEPVESFPGDDHRSKEPDLVPITGKNIWDFQEIDRPFYQSATAPEKPKHLNILLLGMDEAIDEPGRSDAIMVARLNTETEEAAILSIPRDTYIHIPNHGYSKAGHATAYGGTSLAMDTVENFLNISIDHYLRVDMAGFEHSVDALGGVTVDIPERLVHENGDVLFEAGITHMDGEDALEYTRVRRLKEGSGGDHGRIQRQQQVLFEMLRTIRSELSMEEALTFMEEIAPYIRTDIGPGLIMDHWGAFNNLDFSAMDLRTLPGSGFFHEDIYYFRVPVENARIIMDNMAN